MLLFLFGLKPEVEIEYYSGLMDGKEINILYGQVVYKIEIVKPSIKFNKLIPTGIQRGKVKISVITDNFKIGAYDKA
ncbi:hypothetical protein CEE45_00415 [Candidatus Heimdallarchaeota archaeon B3_Heim]|nr:MAG: hypothetical protein CEE45_00415 [Candidatus Heimdallarchaeota archaeon B3_Heim]